MITEQTQIKINLPVALKEFIESRAARFGMPIAGYIKHLILKDVADLEYPTFPASERTTGKALKALKEKDKSTVVKDIHKFFKNLK